MLWKNPVGVPEILPEVLGGIFPGDVRIE